MNLNLVKKFKNSGPSVWLTLTILCSLPNVATAQEAEEAPPRLWPENAHCNIRLSGIKLKAEGDDIFLDYEKDILIELKTDDLDEVTATNRATITFVDSMPSFEFYINFRNRDHNDPTKGNEFKSFYVQNTVLEGEKVITRVSQISDGRSKDTDISLFLAVHNPEIEQAERDYLKEHGEDGSESYLEILRQALPNRDQIWNFAHISCSVASFERKPIEDDL